MWILHLDSLTWQAVTPKSAELPAENGSSAPAVPPVLGPSAGHAMSAWGPKLLIVGGHVKVNLQLELRLCQIVAIAVW